MRKRTAKQEERQELFQYRLMVDFEIDEGHHNTTIYYDNVILTEKEARRRKDQLFRIYEKASLEGRLIHFERIAILKERIKPFQTIV